MPWLAYYSHYLCHLSVIYLLVAGALAVAESEVSLIARDLEEAPSRRLAAAQVSSFLKPRDVEGALRHNHEFHYLEGESTFSRAIADSDVQWQSL